MKTHSMISKVTFSILILTGLVISSCTYINRQNGSGKVIRVEHPAKGFNKVEISLVFDAVIIPGTDEKVVVETDDNLQQYVLVSNSDSTLNVRMKDNVNIGSHSAGTVYIYTKGITSINNSSVGKLTNDGTLTADTFDFSNSSVGNNDLKIKAKKIIINNSSVGKTNLFLDCNMLAFTNSAVGKTLLTGNCDDAHIDNSGVGSFDAQNFTTQVLHIVNSAVGSTDVNASKEIYIDNSGVGRLDVYGACVIKKLDDNGVSKTHKH
ncbi:MAG: DUF2807 domain-containing protein [Bacteroidota bacterium]|nr:DUF2807 domain-containing protein [Bacteroidota bacterium]